MNGVKYTKRFCWCVLLFASVAMAQNDQTFPRHGFYCDGRSYVMVTNRWDIRLDTNYTVEVWLKPEPGTGMMPLFSISDGSSLGSKSLGLDNYHPRWWAGGTNRLKTTEALTPGKWAHLAYSGESIGANQQRFRVHINGQLVSVTTNTVEKDAEAVLELGRLVWNSNTTYSLGTMVDLRYWNEVRTTKDIQKYMVVSLEKNEHLLAHWFYRSGSGISAPDETGRDHNGVVMGAGQGSSVWRSVSPIAGSVSSHLQGLWVGHAAISKVSHAAPSASATNLWDSTTPMPTAQSFPLRLLIHIDEDGGVRLLPEIYVTGTRTVDVLTNSDGLVITNAVTGQPVTNSVLNWSLYTTPANLPPAPTTVNRLSSPAYPYSMGPIALWGETNYLTGLIELPYNDPCNPFVHQYHPDHDNRGPDGETLDAGKESWTITRTLSMQFYETNPDIPNDPHWMVDRWGGEYFETIEGLYKFPLYIQGVFGLQKVNNIGTIK